MEIREPEALKSGFNNVSGGQTIKNNCNIFSKYGVAIAMRLYSMHNAFSGEREEERGLREVVRLNSGIWVTDCKLEFWGSGKSGTLLKNIFLGFETL